MKSFGATWWRASLGLGAALILPNCDQPELVIPDRPPLSEDEHTFRSSVDALSLQRAEGWNVGTEDLLEFDGSSVRDAAGGQSWRRNLESVAVRMVPSRVELVPWYVPTLFQSLIGPQAQLLRAVMRPIRTASMDESFQRGLALRSLFEQAEWPSDTAIVVDAPGASAVAVAAALADRFDPVFTFANWPHPDGVVPAHQTLASVLYYAPVFERARALRPGNAPPLFVLDDARLARYEDDAEQFDNRYFVRLPSAESLRELGVRHVLYVNAAGDPELDDLNEAFVELAAGGVDVGMVSLDEFQRGEVVAEGDPPDDEEAEPDYWVRVDWYWYDGSPGFHACFWDRHRWYHPAHGVTVGPPHGRRLVAVMPGMRRLAPVDTAGWSPSPRPTLFSRLANGWGPVGLGQVAVHSARADGRFAAAGSWGGASYGGSFRSGSLGRFGGGFSS